MEMVLQRFNLTKSATQGLLFVNEKFLCYTLEDVKRSVKIKGETRIPAGRYQVKLRTEGEFHKKYARLFPDIHKGMLHLQDVPGFEYILIHIGNSKSDTMGCILTGLVAPFSDSTETVIEKSKAAYQRMYQTVIPAFDQGHLVFITIRDEEDIAS